MVKLHFLSESGPLGMHLSSRSRCGTIGSVLRKHFATAHAIFAYIGACHVRYRLISEHLCYLRTAWLNKEFVTKYIYYQCQVKLSTSILHTITVLVIRLSILCVLYLSCDFNNIPWQKVIYIYIS